MAEALSHEIRATAQTATVVLVTEGISFAALNGWVLELAELSGQWVRWRRKDGAFEVMTSGDISKVEACIAQLREDLEGRRRVVQATWRQAVEAVRW